jgi:serine/threonine protein kinase/Tol biopolymer transport system component
VTLLPGTRLGPYEIIAAIGAGGMGEVFRARDTKLERDVAIKVLPAAMAQDAERLTRFGREARLLASLNHPNIAHVYGFEGATLPDGSTAHFLAMELVPGDDLAARLGRGAIPVDEAIAIARQIAEGLDEAHEHGIIHRDLKPANVKVTPDGKVKVLDFGLAKALVVDGLTSGSHSQLSHSPTISRHMTEAGMIMGTAAYMSPEQARGKSVDKRSDIWAFGVVLFEMLTGKRLFAGETLSDVLVAVLKTDPDWSVLPPSTPSSVRTLLARCLERDARKRLRDIGEAALVMANPGRAGALEPVARGTTMRERVAWITAAMALVLSALLAARGARSDVSNGPGPLHFAISPEPSEAIQDPRISSDGLKVAFVGRPPGSASDMIFVRSLRETETKVLPGTEGANQIVFSPDGEWVAFFSNYRRLKKIPARGGATVDLAEGNFRSASADWGPDGRLIVAGFDSDQSDQPGLLHEVREDGGPLKPLPARPEHVKEVTRWPRVAQGGGVVLLHTGPDILDLSVQSLATGERRVVARNARYGRFVGKSIVWLEEGKLMAAPFDASRLAFSQAPAPLSMAGILGGLSGMDASASGSLIFGRPATSAARPATTQHLVWIDRQGRRTPAVKSEGSGLYDPRLSPDGTRVVAHGSLGTEENDVWNIDLRRGALSRLSLTQGEDETGVWSPDGAWIAWASSRVGGGRALYRRASDGSGKEERLWDSQGFHFHTASWTVDSKAVLVTQDNPRTGWDVMLVSLGEKAASSPILTEPFNETSARLSPDGRWLAYVSDEAGRSEIYARAFPDLSRKVQVSVTGGAEPVWHPDGNEIVYRSLASRDFMNVSVRTQGTFSISAPRVLTSDRAFSRGNLDHTRYALARDGRLPALEAGPENARGDMGFVLGWAQAAGLLK